jgi:hypothetical protein
LRISEYRTIAVTEFWSPLSCQLKKMLYCHYNWLWELKSKNLSVSYFIQIVVNILPIPYFNKVQIISLFQDCTKWGSAFSCKSVSTKMTSLATAESEVTNRYIRAALHLNSLECPSDGQNSVAVIVHTETTCHKRLTLLRN